MALIDETTAQEVLGLTNLAPATFGMEDKAEVYRHINRQILPTLNAMVQDLADDAAAPLDFPLSAAVIAEARGWTGGTDAEEALIQQKQANQVALWQAVVKYRAAGELMLTANTKSTNADERRAAASIFFELAEQTEAKAIKSVQDIVAHTRAGGAADVPSRGGATLSTVRKDCTDLLTDVAIN